MTSSPTSLDDILARSTKIFDSHGEPWIQVITHADDDLFLTLRLHEKEPELFEVSVKLTANDPHERSQFLEELNQRVATHESLDIEFEQENDEVVTSLNATADRATVEALYDIVTQHLKEQSQRSSKESISSEDISDNELSPFESIGPKDSTAANVHPIPECERVASHFSTENVHLEMSSLPEGILLSLKFEHRVTKATYHQLAVEWCDYLLLRYEIHATPYSNPFDSVDTAHVVQVIAKWDDNRHLVPRRGHRFGSLEQLLEKHIELIQRLGISDQEVFRQVISLGGSAATTIRSRNLGREESSPIYEKRGSTGGGEQDSEEKSNETVFKFDHPDALSSVTPISLEESSASVVGSRRSSLFDVELTTSGYSEFRTGKVLSIVLSIAYPDAVELLRQAPCTIVWSISGEEAMKVKSLIERTGAKVTLLRANRANS